MFVFLFSSKTTCQTELFADILDIFGIPYSVSLEALRGGNKHAYNKTEKLLMN